MMKFLCRNSLSDVVKHIQKTLMGLGTRPRLVMRRDKIMIDALKEAQKERLNPKHFVKVMIIIDT